MISSSFRSSALLVLSTVLLACVTPALAQNAGVAAIVVPDASGTPPGGASRTLQIGSDIVIDEVIRTGEAGRTQVLFTDGSTITLSANAEVVIDRFVYDPDKRTASMALTSKRGLMRLVGGLASKSEGGVTVTTQVAVIGIRGGIGTIEIDPQTDAVEAVMDYGRSMSVQSGASSTLITQPGFAVTIASLQSIGAPLRLDAARILERNARLEGRPGAPLRAVTATPTGVSAVNSAASPDSITPQSPVPQTVGNEVSVIGQLNSAGSVTGSQVVSGSQNTQLAQGRNQTLLANQTVAGVLTSTVANAGFVDVGSAGLVRGQLAWTTTADLDLYAQVPNVAQVIFFGNRTASFNAGQATVALDRDNLGGTIDKAPNLRIENIVVKGVVPAGLYSFYARYFGGSGAQSYTLTVTPDGGRTSQVQQGVLAAPGAVGPTVTVQSPGGITR